MYHFTNAELAWDKTKTIVETVTCLALFGAGGVMIGTAFYMLMDTATRIMGR